MHAPRLRILGSILLLALGLALPCLADEPAPFADVPPGEESVQPEQELALDYERLVALERILESELGGDVGRMLMSLVNARYEPHIDRLARSYFVSPTRANASSASPVPHR